MSSERDWIIPAAAFVAVQQVATLVIVWRGGGSGPYLDYGLAALATAIIVAAILISIEAFRTLRARPERPLKFFGAALASDRQRYSIFIIGFGLAWLQLVTLTWTKSLIPQVAEMWADQPLAELDAWAFGTDAWRAVSFVPFGQEIDILYSLWALFLKLTLAAVLLAKPSRRKSVSLLAFFLTIGIVGVLGQFLLPSGGPIFWERLGHGNRFADLVPPAHTAVAANYLWAKYLGHSADFASGISAFPSMHVAMAMWMALSVRAIYPKWQLAAWAYFVVIGFGSVFLGWHYASDGLAGIAGAIACVAVAGWIISARGFPQLKLYQLFTRRATATENSSLAEPTKELAKPKPMRSGFAVK